MKKLAMLMLGLLLADGAQATSFAIEQGRFVRDGKPYVIRSGEMHYPRIPHEAWRDRLRKAKAMGLNTITTYAFWNVNEPGPGHFDFTGDRDIAAFVRTAQEEGLDVILRPGPYVCAEWDFGGFPAWLLHTPGLRVRSMDPRFLQASAAWFKRLHQELAPLLVSKGGPIIMVQVENEYGSYGEDHDYLQAIHQQIVDAGFDVPLFTSNGPGPTPLERGTLPGIASVINFDGTAEDARKAFESSAPYLKDSPKMTGEYWSGWYDRFGEPHQRRSTDLATGAVAWFLDHDISFNLYMVDGGTNFGWMNGANGSSTTYFPVTTSYDYDAPIDEAGRLTPKYEALRKTIGAHLAPGEALPAAQASSVTMAIPEITLDESVTLLDALPALSKPVASVRPRNMEAFGQGYGLILYRKPLDAASKGALDLGSVRDVATVLVDGKVRGTLDRRLGQHALTTPMGKGNTLDVLVENTGRINFGGVLPDEYKGLTREVTLDGDGLFDWNVYPLPLNDLSGLAFGKGAVPAGPVFRRGHFTLGKTAGSFLDMRGWTRGHVWVNGHHLGRFWDIGPQGSLYVPGEWLHKGRNEIVVLDMGSSTAHGIRGLADPVWTEPVAKAP